MKPSLHEIINADLRRLFRWILRGVDVDIPFNSINSILLISEDITGPIHKSLIVKLETGEKRQFEDAYEIGKFVEHIGPESAEVAARIRHELGIERNFPCWEVLLYESGASDPP